MLVLTNPQGQPNEIVELLNSGQGPIRAQNIESPTPASQNLNVDGLTPIQFTILAANHPAGMYNWSLYLVKRVAASAGNLQAQLFYRDTSGAAILLRPNAALTGTGHFNLAPFPIWSTGVDPLVVDLTFPGVAGGTLQMDIYNSVFKVG
jgi:hypothetical protein